MSEEEAASFLWQERTVTCATQGPRGWPHLMPLWYVLRDAQPGGSIAVAPEAGSSASAGEAAEAGEAGTAGPRIWAWTYAVSQKVRNLERDARATLQVEAGEQYQELRGLMFECDVRIHRELGTVAALGNEIFCRYAADRGEPPVAELAPEVKAMVDKQAAKRVALEFVERRRASWDHRKLGVVY
ncbi:MAG TPA: pyridoxamine 5'-phosphate oxidase family protein [Solirubrobacteraceae bacterium]|nr:pyridoxamine 5'-phosphate oxidase family protein [Solirubrobacteraceae bacterium]